MPFAGRVSIPRIDSPACMPDDATLVQSFCGVVGWKEMILFDSVTATTPPGALAGEVVGGAAAMPRIVSPEFNEVIAPTEVAAPVVRLIVYSVEPVVLLNTASAVFEPSEAVEISKPVVALPVTPSGPTAVSVPLF